MRFTATPAAVVLLSLCTVRARPVSACLHRFSVMRTLIPTMYEGKVDLMPRSHGRCGNAYGPNAHFIGVYRCSSVDQKMGWVPLVPTTPIIPITPISPITSMPFPFNRRPQKKAAASATSGAVYIEAVDFPVNPFLRFSFHLDAVKLLHRLSPLSETSTHGMKLMFFLSVPIHSAISLEAFSTSRSDTNSTGECM